MEKGQPTATALLGKSYSFIFSQRFLLPSNTRRLILHPIWIHQLRRLWTWQLLLRRLLFLPALLCLLRLGRREILFSRLPSALLPPSMETPVKIVGNINPDQQLMLL